MELDASADPAEFIRELNAEMACPRTCAKWGSERCDRRSDETMQPRMFAPSLTLALAQRGI